MADYAARLSAYPNKGVCGLPERTDSARVTSTKLRKLADMVREANHVVVLTGAGISTSAGIPDFRGPNGVWTLEKKREREEKRRRKREASLATKAASEATTSGGEDGAAVVEGSQSESELPVVTAVKAPVGPATGAAAVASRPVDGDDCIGQSDGGCNDSSHTGVERQQQQQQQRRQQKDDRESDEGDGCGPSRDKCGVDDEGDGGDGTSRDLGGTDEKRCVGQQSSSALATGLSTGDDDDGGGPTAGVAAAKCDAEGECSAGGPAPVPQSTDTEQRPPSKRRRSETDDGYEEAGDGSSDPVEAEPAAAQDESSKPTTSAFQKARPTFTHRAITAMVERDLVQYCVTQNVDGLHRRSGLPRSKMSVLHGCVFTERCERCQREHFRTFDVGGVSFQRTGRTCDHPDCDGHLRDTILDWEDELPHGEFALATEHCKGADLVLCLGTSLRIEPAGSLPLLARRFVVVNMQETPRDKNADLIIRARVDDVMADLTARLGVVVPVEDDDDDDDYYER